MKLEPEKKTVVIEKFDDLIKYLKEERPESVAVSWHVKPAYVVKKTKDSITYNHKFYIRILARYSKTTEIIYEECVYNLMLGSAISPEVLEKGGSIDPIYFNFVKYAREGTREDFKRIKNRLKNEIPDLPILE
jgi:hypothetical protein